MPTQSQTCAILHKNNKEIEHVFCIFSFD